MYENIDIEDFLDKICMIDPSYKKEIQTLEKEFNCEICPYIEKIHALQYTIYYDIDFGPEYEETFNVEISSGIDNGTELINAEWGYDTKTSTKIQTVLEDVVFDESKFNSWYTGKEENKNFVKTKANFIFNNNKQALLKLHKEQSYDNYVTGGGTNKTDTYYKNRHLELESKGVFWEFVYSDIEVDRNFI